MNDQREHGQAKGYRPKMGMVSLEYSWPRVKVYGKAQLFPS